MPIFTDLSDVRLSYDKKTDTVRLSCADPRLNKEPFAMVLPNGSHLNELARKILEEEGLAPSSHPEPAAASKESSTLFSSLPAAQLEPTEGDDDSSTPKRLPHGKRQVPLGVSPANKPVDLFENEVRAHAMIFGSTGAGKTEAIKTLAGGLLDLGWDGMILDLKSDTGEGGLRDWCDSYTQHHAQGYQELTVSGEPSKTWFEPLSGLSPEEARDVIVSMQAYEVDYYQALTQQLLGELLTVLYKAHEIDPAKHEMVALEMVGKVLSAPSLANAVKPYMVTVTTAGEYQLDDFRALRGNDKNFNEAARAIGARIMADLTSYGTKNVLNRPTPGNARPLFDAAASGMSYVGLDPLGKVTISRLIGASILKRLSGYASERISSGGSKAKTKPRFIIIDEAHLLEHKALLSLISRARSAGIAIILASQSPLDWKDSYGNPDIENFAQNTNIKIVMGQSSMTAAAASADLLGPDTTGSRVIDLRIGEAIMAVARPNERCRYLKVSRRNPQK